MQSRLSSLSGALVSIIQFLYENVFMYLFTYISVGFADLNSRENMMCFMIALFH